MAVSDQQWNLGTEALNGKDGDTARAAGTKFNAHLHQTTDAQAAIDGAAAPAAGNVFATMADVGGGGLTLKTATLTTSTLLGDGTSTTAGDLDLTLTEGHEAVVTQVFVRRFSGTGASPTVAFSVYDTAALRTSDGFGDGIYMTGDGFTGVALDVLTTPGDWVHGPRQTGSSDIKFTIPVRDASFANTIRFNVKNFSGGSTPADDFVAEVRLVYYETPISLA